VSFQIETKLRNCEKTFFTALCHFWWNAAWNQFKFIPKNRKIRYGFVPHIGKEFFGTGNEEFIDTITNRYSTFSNENTVVARCDSPIIHKLKVNFL
jgi:hypothetical protein